MIKNVSWADYFTLLAVLCAIYYAVVILLFYRDEFVSLITSKKKPLPKAVAPPTSAPIRPVAGSSPATGKEVVKTKEELLYGKTNLLIQELNQVFAKEYVKGELLTALQVVMRKYNELKGTAFQVSINNYLLMESENRCSVSLSEGEIRGLWNG